MNNFFNHKTKLAKIIDDIFIILICFSLSFLIFAKFINRTIINIILAIALSTFLFFMYKHKANIHENKIALDSKTKKLKENTLLALKFGNPTAIHNFFVYALGKKYNVLNKKTKLITFIANETDYTLYYNFTEDVVTLKDLKENFKANLVLGNSFSADAISYAKNKNIILLNKDETFLMLNSLNIYPYITSKLNTSKKSLINLFSSKTGFTLLKLGFIMLVISFFIPFKTYYKTVAIIFIILSVFCFIFSPKQKATRYFFSN